jgi:hypothetical protein
MVNRCPPDACREVQKFSVDSGISGMSQCNNVVAFLGQVMVTKPLVDGLVGVISLQNGQEITSLAGR